MLDFGAFEILSFDCYGTLIDWETGLLRALRPILEAHGVAMNDEAILEIYATLESAAETGPYRRYREILRGIVDGFGGRLGFAPSDAERESLPASLPGWPPFLDTIEALRALKRRCRLAVLSNVDDDLFAGTARRLGVAFGEVVTAEQVRSYKPSRRNFEAALARYGIPKERVLHIAQSVHHDIVPAKAVGLATVWVNRRRGKPGSGATLPASTLPDLEVPDLATFVRYIDP